MQKKVEDLLEMLEDSRMDLSASTIERSMKVVECKNVDWRMFKVYRHSENYVLAMLDKLQAHFFVAAATALDATVKAKELELIIIEGDDEEVDEMSTIVNRGTLYVTITLSKESQRFLLPQ